MAPPRWLKPGLFILLFVPMAALAIAWARLLNGQAVPWLTAEPVAQTTRELGEWSLRILLGALAVTPIARLTGWTPILSTRRMIGLIAFTYVLVHWSFWMWLELDWSLGELVKEVTKRRFILAGMVGFVCLLPLAVTSTRGWVKRLGGRRWQTLHSLAYVAGAAGCIHYAMLVKGNQPAPKIYLAILALLLVLRSVPQQKWLRPGRA
jgi:sulfoxide reductase heme-binding subunit YedZ